MLAAIHQRKRGNDAGRACSIRPATAPNTAQRGFFVSFDYSQEAPDEVTKFLRNTGRIIKLITVQEILDERHLQKM